MAIAAPEDDGREHADFLHLLDATAAEREAWLAEAAARCESYARRLRTLLAEVEGDLGRIEEERRDPDLGRRIGRWRLIRSLGRGATARVSLGVDEGVAEGHPGCRAAIKLFDRVDFGSGFRKRLEREIEALRRIDHPGVVRFLADGTDDATGRPWVAMEFVDGAMPIVEWASVRAATVDERAELVRQLREALAAAHAAGVVHRDLSPGNVLVDRDGRVKIVDFGIAALVRESIGRGGSVSASGFLLGGTPATMAPEQVEPSLGPIGPWTDEYAAAVIAFRLFAGRFPYDTSGSLASVAQAVVHVPVLPVREFEPAMPPALAAWIDAALVKRPEWRRKAIARAVRGAAPTRRRTGWITYAALGAAMLAAAFAARGRVGSRGAVPAAGQESDESTIGQEEAMTRDWMAVVAAGSVSCAALADDPGTIVPSFWASPAPGGFVSASVHGDLALFGRQDYPGGGGAYVCRRVGGTWTLDPTVLVPPGSRSLFGKTVEVTAEWVFVGDAPDPGGAVGRLHVWRREGGALVYRQALNASDGFGGNAFGWDACQNGNELFVTARFDSSWRGAVYRFELGANGYWQQRQKIQAPNTGPGSEFGWEIESVGDRLLATAWLSECGYSFPSGSFHVFKRGVDGDFVHETSSGDGIPGCSGFAYTAAIWSGSVIVGSDASSSLGLSIFRPGLTGWNRVQRTDFNYIAWAGQGIAVAWTAQGVVRVLQGAPETATVGPLLSIPSSAGLYIHSGSDGKWFAMAHGHAIGIWDIAPDCDSDGTPDSVEIAQGAQDVNANGIPDTCECLADVDESGAVNAVDLAAVLGVWGTSGGKYPRADIDGNGVVNAQDLAAVLGGWGPCP